MTNIKKDGRKRRYDIKNKGAECKLSHKQLVQLARDLEAGPEKFGYETSMWTMPLANMHIKKTFGVDYNDHSMWQLVRRMGFRLVKPRPKLQKSATPKEIEEFKKSSKAGEKVGKEGTHSIDGGRGSHRAWIRA